MPYTILPATPADLPDIAAIYHAAFAGDSFIGQLMASVPPEVKNAYDMHWYGREFDMCELNGLRFRKIVDEEGKPVGFAKWQYPFTLTPEQEAKKAELDKAEELEHPLPDGSNRELYEVFFSALREKKARWMDESKDYCDTNVFGLLFEVKTCKVVRGFAILHILGILPAHQRKGLGGMLIREGLADADRNTARTYIEASPSGYELYLRHGWKQVDEIVIDVGKYGGQGVATEKLLVRAPGAK